MPASPKPTRSYSRRAGFCRSTDRLSVRCPCSRASATRAASNAPPTPLPRANDANREFRDVGRHETPARFVNWEEAVPRCTEALPVFADSDDSRITGTSPAVEVATDVRHGKGGIPPERTHLGVHSRRLPPHVPEEWLVVWLGGSDDEHGNAPRSLYHAVVSTANREFADTP